MIVLIGLYLAGSIGLCSGGGCYGSVILCKTSGISCKNEEDYCGHFASLDMASIDLNKIEKYLRRILFVGRRLCMDSAVIAAVMSRESRVGSLLERGWSENGISFGLMQINTKWHKPRGTWDSEEHITQATEILAECVHKIQRKFPKWSKSQQLKGGLAAYNAGAENVKSFKKLDYYTTHGDYANDVVARAIFYKTRRI